MAVVMPVIGDWYQKPGGQLFEVVAVDETDGTIEIQYFDRAVAEIDLEAWHDSHIMSAEAPEDYSGSLDIEPEDYGAELSVAGHKDWADPLDYLDQAE